MKENDNQTIEMQNLEKEGKFIQDNTPKNLTSTSNEIEFIFQKIRKKNRENEAKKSLKDYGNQESKDISNLLVNPNQKMSSEEMGKNSQYTILANLFSFILFYFSFIPLSNYFCPISCLIFPIDLVSFIFCALSAIISAIVFSLILIKKIYGYHLLYMIIYYSLIFFLHFYKFIGKTHFDQSLSVFFIFITLIFQFICITCGIYFTVKYFYYEGKIKKDNFLIKPFVTYYN